jgi:hypothetical protein
MMALNGPEDLLQRAAVSAFAAIHPPKQAGWVAEALVTGLAAGGLGLVGSVPLWADAAVLLTVGTLLWPTHVCRSRHWAGWRQE